MRTVIVALLLLIAGTLSASAQSSNKCLTPEIVLRHWRARSELKEAYAAVRPVMQKSIVSPGGRFRLHFDTTGTNQPALVAADGTRIPNSYTAFVDTVARIYDQVWNTEIDSFGFAVPPADGGRGGGDEIDVYITNLGGGLFGYTDWDEDNELSSGIPNPRYSAFILMDNDFGTGYRTKGINAILATAAHEFHHVIQIETSGLWFNDFYFYELSAESMESTVFSSSRDYLFDVATYFSNIGSISLFLPQTASFSGYERAVFGIFLMKRYGTHFMQEVWDHIATQRPILAVQAAFAGHSTTLQREYAEYSIWNYYTGNRADNVRGYPDAARFPPLDFTATVTLTGSPEDIGGLLFSFSSNYYRVVKGTDTSDLVLSNVNVEDAVAGTKSQFPVILTVAPYQFDGGRQIGPSVYLSMSTPSTDLSQWNLSLFSESILPPIASAEVIPNPFNPARTSLLIAADKLDGYPATLMVFSSSMDLVYTGPANTLTYFGKRMVGWNGRGNNGGLVSSGIYFYVLQSDRSSTIKGKFAVVR